MFYHVWFLTKYRRMILEGEIEKRAKEIFAECIQRHNYHVLAFETNRDHVHMLVEAKDRKSLSGIIRTLKAVSAKEILGTPHFRVGNVRRGKKVFWARRYGCKGVTQNELEGIRSYVLDQKKILHTAVCREPGLTHHA